MASPPGDDDVCKLTVRAVLTRAAWGRLDFGGFTSADQSGGADNHRTALSYCFDRVTVPNVEPLHESRPDTAVSRVDVTTTLIRVKLRGADPPLDPESVKQGGDGVWT